MIKNGRERRVSTSDSIKRFWLAGSSILKPQRNPPLSRFPCQNLCSFFVFLPPIFSSRYPGACSPLPCVHLISSAHTNYLLFPFPLVNLFFSLPTLSIIFSLPLWLGFHNIPSRFRPCLFCVLDPLFSSSFYFSFSSLLAYFFKYKRINE